MKFFFAQWLDSSQKLLLIIWSLLLILIAPFFTAAIAADLHLTLHMNAVLAQHLGGVFVGLVYGMTGVYAGLRVAECTAIAVAVALCQILVLLTIYAFEGVGSTCIVLILFNVVLWILGHHPPIVEKA